MRSDESVLWVSSINSSMNPLCRKNLTIRQSLTYKSRRLKIFRYSCINILKFGSMSNNSVEVEPAEETEMVSIEIPNSGGARNLN
ncbi:hypothetical protein CDAR_30811 [Caerostris darwini]|uniref:Uncharacterized protein n=1 Tax=Caerostris darwini TaxID=1538125 RepID=A0AAV4NRZ6_9ARAC|nr:hypothetical protein CDAR_30811 [Caerostris darwini]